MSNTYSRISLKHYVDSGELGKLHSELKQVDGSDLIIDLAGLQFLPTLFLQLLISATTHYRALEHTVKLENLCPEILNDFDLIGLKQLNIFPEVDQ